MTRDVRPTQPDEEAGEGRIAVWLAPDDIRFLAKEWRKIPDDAPEPVRETWARIAFRLNAALHKAGCDNDPDFPAAAERYRLDSWPQKGSGTQ